MSGVKIAYQISVGLEFLPQIIGLHEKLIRLTIINAADRIDEINPNGMERNEMKEVVTSG